MSGSTPNGSSASASVNKLFNKNPEDSPTAEVPQVPIERQVSSPRRTLGKGRRDTVLTGSDGLQ